MSTSTIIQMKGAVAKSSFLRFLISGGINTSVTYLVYLSLLKITGYKAAFTIAYVLGIALAFAINRLFVFQTHRGWRSVIMFPFVYLIQYLASITIVWLWVEKFGLPMEAAPLTAIVVTIPLTFVLSRLVFGRSVSHASENQPDVRTAKINC
jgi:Predicted membrane protein